MTDLNQTWQHSKRWNLWLPDFGFGVEVCSHHEKRQEERGAYDFPCFWNTYLLFSDALHFSRDGELCEPYAVPSPIVTHLWANRECLDGLEEWHHGVTFREFTTDHHGVRRIKIGDDYQHVWDEGHTYSLHYVQRQVLKIAQEAKEFFDRVLVVKVEQEKKKLKKAPLTPQDYP